MRTLILAPVLAVCATIPAMAAENVVGKPTFSRDVAPIVYKHCLECHRPGEAAPMSLRTYEEARPWAKSIKEKVSARLMPPWYADPAHGKFSNDARLSESEIETLVGWVDAGAPKGNPKDMPETPTFAEGWRMGEPDFIVDLPEVTVPADGGDYFPDLTFSANVLEGKWIRAIEVRPGNRAVAHHVVIFMNGMAGMSGGGMSNFNVLGVWSVGTEPNVYPEGMGRRLPPGQRLMANMHYHPNGTATTDQTRIGLYYGEGELKHEVQAALAGSFSLRVPAGEPNHQETASWYVDRDIKIISMFPHMHWRGKDMKLTAAYPDGKQDVLLNVPSYDFNWQLFYYPTDGVALPAGSRIDVVAHYDNSANNPNNPDPTRDVYFGTATTDEMLFGIFEYIHDDEKGKVLAPEDKLAQFAATFPAGEAYEVNLLLGGGKIPSVIHLPRQGDGQWIILFGGTQFSLPLEHLSWKGDSCEADLVLRFGRMGGSAIMKATIEPDGKLVGKLMSDGATPFIIPGFEGKLYTK